MPKPVDYRDLPHVWGEGFYVMNEDALRARLKNAKLVLGPVEETVPQTFRSGAVPPVGFVAFDLDYYSSTKAAFQIFEGASEHSSAARPLLFRRHLLARFRLPE